MSQQGAILKRRRSIEALGNVMDIYGANIARLSLHESTHTTHLPMLLPTLYSCQVSLFERFDFTFHFLAPSRQMGMRGSKFWQKLRFLIHFS
jgi:hypothetical protein